MSRNKTTSGFVDGVLNTLVNGGVLATAVAAPNALKSLDKPLRLYLKKMDKRAREREYSRLLRYMKQQGLIKYSTKDYEHGVQLTKKGEARVREVELENLKIKKPRRWDNTWRVVLFDIPEQYKYGRDHLSAKLKQLGFIQLQKSVWVHPFPCKDEVSAVVLQYNINRYVTYLETSHIDSQEKLIARFKFNF